jgi:transposase-like protein
VQILHPFAGSIQQYAEEITDPDRHRPKHCLQCQAQHSLTAHGFYSRTLVDAGFDGSIRVRRYLCRSCKRTVSLLPEFALPISASVSLSCRCF